MNNLSDITQSTRIKRIKFVIKLTVGKNGKGKADFSPEIPMLTNYESGKESIPGD